MRSFCAGVSFANTPMRSLTSASSSSRIRSISAPSRISLGVKTNVVAHLASDYVVVAGQYLHRHTTARQGRYGLSSTLLLIPHRGRSASIQGSISDDESSKTTAHHHGAQTYHIGAVSRSCRTWYRHRPSDGEREFDPRFLRGERLSRISQPEKGRPQLPARSRGATSWANNRMELSTQSTGIWPPTFDSMMMPVRPSSSRSCRSRASTTSGVP
jgi:hypothetical protein